MAALSSLMVLTGRIGDEEVVVVAFGDDDNDDDGGVIGEVVDGGSREGLAAVATTLPSSRRDRLNPGSYEVDPEICERKFGKCVFCVVLLPALKIMADVAESVSHERTLLLPTTYWKTAKTGSLTKTLFFIVNL